jgi:hypothetical protein
MSGYEIVANGKATSDTPSLIYQVMLFNNEDEYYLIVGQANENIEGNLKAYRTVTQTFKRK